MRKFVFLLIGGIACPAVAQPTAETMFVGFSVMICMQSGAEPAAIQRIAESKMWTKIAPEDSPGESASLLVDGKSYSNSSTWTFVQGRTRFWVDLIEVPEHPKNKYCSLEAYDLDSRAVSSVFSGEADNVALEFGKAPVLIKYDFPEYNGMAHYMLSGTRDKVLHRIAFFPKISLSK